MKIKKGIGGFRLSAKRAVLSVAAVAFVVGVVPAVMTLKAHADVGGIFAVNITPVKATILSGEVAQYRVDYSCRQMG